MGLIKSTLTNLNESIKCNELNNELLMKKITPVNGIITKDCTILVEPGQIAIVIQNGMVLDATAEPGTYILDNSVIPSFFAGEFGPSFKVMWNGLKFNNELGQSIIYLNTKEIILNKFGTTGPIPYQEWSYKTGINKPLDIFIKCYGKYTFKINNPALFLSKIGIVDSYHKNLLIEPMRPEIISLFQNVLNELIKIKTPVLELPNSTDKIKQIMTQNVFIGPTTDRGLKILSFIVEDVTVVNTKDNQQNLLSKPSEVNMIGNEFKGNPINNQNVNIQNQQPLVTNNTSINFCTKCGNKINGENFCTNCGNKLI